MTDLQPPAAVIFAGYAEMQLLSAKMASEGGILDDQEVDRLVELERGWGEYLSYRGRLDEYRLAVKLAEQASAQPAEPSLTERMAELRLARRTARPRLGGG